MHGVRRSHPSFNEAAGIPRGRRNGSASLGPVGSYRFNEAAGIPRGRPLKEVSKNMTLTELQ